MNTTGRQGRGRRRIRGKSDFATFDEIALFSDALVGGELGAGSTGHGSERLLMLRVLSAWSRAVGPHLKAVARPASYRQGRVIVDVRDIGWKRELERARPEILSRMIRLLPDHPIHEISFRLGSAVREEAGAPAPGQDGARPAGSRQAPTVTPAPHQDAAGDLEDHLRRVMGRYLARSH